MLAAFFQQLISAFQSPIHVFVLADIAGRLRLCCPDSAAFRMLAAYQSLLPTNLGIIKMLSGQA